MTKTSPVFGFIVVLSAVGITCTADRRPEAPAIEQRVQKLVVAETFAHTDIGAVAAPGSFGESQAARSP